MVWAAKMKCVVMREYHQMWGEVKEELCNGSERIKIKKSNYQK